MEAKELRIGNYVYAQSGKLVVNRDSIYKVENVNMQSARKYEPIPLTEEWLLKFGFEKVEYKEWIMLLPSNNCETFIEVNIEDDENHRIDIWTEIDGRGAWVNTTNKYVHQLQNLYFALTGEELQLK